MNYVFHMYIIYIYYDLYNIHLYLNEIIEAMLHAVIIIEC